MQTKKIEPSSGNGLKSFRPKALQASNTAPDFTILKANGSWQKLPETLENLPYFKLSQLIRLRPLVLSFYSPSWSSYGDIHLELLQKAHKRIKDIGAEILILTNVGPENLSRLTQKYKLSINICYDQNNQIARSFGIFSENYPIWKRTTGISEQVPLPATYIIMPNRLIIHDFVDEDFDNFFSIRELEAFIKVYLRN